MSFGITVAAMPRRRSFNAVATATIATLSLTSAVFVDQGMRAQTEPAPVAGSAHSAVISAQPLQLQAALSSAMGAAGAGYKPLHTAHGFALVGGGVSAFLTASGVTFRTGDSTASLSLQGRWNARAAAPSAAELGATGNRVTLTRGSLREWYAAGPLGIEQGFTVAHEPAGNGSVSLRLRIGGNLRAREVGSQLLLSTASGTEVLRYGGLATRDANGRALPSRMALHGRTLTLHVDAAGARYPLSVDPFVEQAKVVPTDNTGSAYFGATVAVSSDGNTALIGGWEDNSDAGAAWVFTRSDGTWTEQTKIVPPADAVGAHPELGDAVALSADGDTALIGGPGDASAVGAAWVYTRSGSSWTEQQKIAPTDNSGASAFGISVALSQSGDLALIGGKYDTGSVGAVWFYGRTGSSWSKLQKVVPSDSSGAAQFGSSVALSSDGDTALIGGYRDGTYANGSYPGAAWVYQGSGSTWTEQQKITPPSDTSGGYPPQFGTSVSLSSDGNTALVGGPIDGAELGAAWIFTRSGSSWSEAQKLVPNDNAGSVTEFGSSAALSADGQVALIGGQNDGVTTNTGAAWLYSGAPGSFTEAGKLSPSDETGDSDFGQAVALSGAGLAVIGGPNDNAATGAFWVYPAAASPTAPSVTGVAPSSGPATGGTAVTITGSELTGATAVHFGSNAATNVTVVNDGQISATAPAGTGAVDVTVTAPGGTSATSAADIYTYVVPAPTVTAISPSSGPQAGGTTVTITGTNLTAATAVDFGSTAASGVHVVSATQVTAVAPAGSGTVDVTVATPAGTSAKSGADEYAYQVPTPPPGPTCTLRAPSAVVSVAKPPHRVKHPKPASGTITVKAACDQAATGSVSGTVTLKIKPTTKHGHVRTVTVHLASHSVAFGASPASVKFTVPVAVVTALKAGDAGSAVFKLAASNANGSAATSVAIERLRL